MNYSKLDKKMRKSGVEYTVEEKYLVTKIQTDPSKNDIAQKIIETALGKNEACINSTPGRFRIVQTDVRVYRITVESLEQLRS